MKDISFAVQLFKEGDVYVAYAPELDVSSCGDTPEEACKNIQEAAQGFLDTSQEIGILNEVLEEAGYQLEGETWRAPEFVSHDGVVAEFCLQPRRSPS